MEANFRETPVVGDVVGAGLLPVDAVHRDIEEHVELAQVGPVPGQSVLAGVALAVGRPVFLELGIRNKRCDEERRVSNDDPNDTWGNHLYSLVNTQESSSP